MDVSADEYLNWGRTRLRVELKKRGLSPSGLKTELLARLEEYFKRQKANGGSAGHASGGGNNNNYNNQSQYARPRSSSSSSPAVGSGYAQQQQQQTQPHLLPKQHHSKQLLDLFHHQLQQQSEAAAASFGELPRKRSRKSHTPQRGLQSVTDNNTSSEGEGSDHTSGDNSSPHSSASSPSRSYNGSDLYVTNNCYPYNHLGNDFPVHPHKKLRLSYRHSQHESDDNAAHEAAAAASSEGATSTVLTGRAFKKESGQVHAPHAEVRSVETLQFGPGDRFHFTHRFWRGKLLRRRFDFYGTYTIVPSSNETTAPTTTTTSTGAANDMQLHDLVTLSCALAAGDAGEKDGAAAKTDEGRLKERTEGKVILHWPSKLDAPELREWPFDQSYSHLFLAATALSSPSGLGSSADAASLQPGSTSPVVGPSTTTRKRPHFLYTKHSAVFVEDTC